jgi:hypothetical protein
MRSDEAPDETRADARSETALSSRLRGTARRSVDLRAYRFVMATTDPEQARSRFVVALRRIAHGLEIQRARIMGRTAQAPKLFGGTDHEVTDLTGDAGNDLDYYIYEMARLRELTRTISNAFDHPGRDR